MPRILLTSFIFSAFAIGAEAKPIIITAFPYTIVAPGNYQVASYLSGRWSSAPGTNITINVLVPGKVVLDLNGYNLSPYEALPDTFALGYSEDAIDVFAGTDVTIQNGSIGSGAYGFGTDIYVNANANAPSSAAFDNNGAFKPPFTGFFSGITINNVRFVNVSSPILFNCVNNSTVKNCSVILSEDGITDYNSRYGNTYVNNSFDTYRNAFVVSGYNSTHIQVGADFNP